MNDATDLIEDEPIQTPLGPMLPRKPAARYLKRKWGFGSAAFLAKAALDGSGPIFHRVSLTEAWYPVSGLDAFAKAKLGEPRATFRTEAA